VGLVTGACFAELGHTVLCVDNDLERVKGLQAARIPFYEPRLQVLVTENASRGRLRFDSDLAAGVRHGRVIFIAVGTPPKPDGSADLSTVGKVVRSIGRAMLSHRLIVEKSTVPVETGRWLKRVLRGSAPRGVPFDVASNPEFLREGSAVRDFLEPDRIVVGVESARARRLLEELYKPFRAKLLVTDIGSAELIKHASNAFLSTKISFINAVGELCGQVGADVRQVAAGMGLDPRIGPAFLNAGIGFGGFCFPKDLEAFIHIAKRRGVDPKLLKAVQGINRRMPELFVGKIRKALGGLRGRTIGLLGLAFKPDTDDMRFAPAISIVRALRKGGARVRAYDPQAMTEAGPLLPGVLLAPDPYRLAEGCDCLALITEWNEFKELDFRRIKRAMRRAVLADGRNLYDPAQIRRFGFRYVGMGNGADA